MTPHSHHETKDRVLAAASALFAERGFHGTKARDIAARAGVNLAASNYHYGSKRDLYLEVLRAQFAEIRSLLAARGASKPASELNRLSRRAIEALMLARAQTMLDLLLGPPPGLHGTLMQREMTDPSEALPVIVEEFIVPMMREIEQIVTQLAPHLSRAAAEHCAYSIVGQVLFYRFARPAMLQVQGWKEYPRGLTRQLAGHITAFSLGGLEQVASRARRKRPRR